VLPGALLLHRFVSIGIVPLLNTGGVMAGGRETVEGVVKHAHLQGLLSELPALFLAWGVPFECLQQHQVRQESQLLQQQLGDWIWE